MLWQAPKIRSAALGGRSTAFRGGAQGRIRTTDTRIFSPLLYQLSYLGDLVLFSLSYCFCLGEEILIFCGGASPPYTPRARNAAPRFFGARNYSALICHQKREALPVMA